MEKCQLFVLFTNFRYCLNNKRGKPMYWPPSDFQAFRLIPQIQATKNFHIYVYVKVNLKMLWRE